MQSKRCPNCGATTTITNENICKCSYCGSVLESNDSTSNYSGTMESYEKKDIKPFQKLQFNAALFVILLIFCWPIAVIYALIASKPDNNKK